MIRCKKKKAKSKILLFLFLNGEEKQLCYIPCNNEELTIREPCGLD